MKSKMKNKVLRVSFIVVFLLFCGLLGGIFYADTDHPFAGGNGEVENPYQITTPKQLHKMRNYRDKHFILMQDICLDVEPYNTGDGWAPIGNSSSGQRFTGSFDGDGYVIRNLFIDRPGTNYQGLFGYIQNATIKNLELADLYVHGSWWTGGLAGYILNSRVEEVKVNGQVTGSYTGALAGQCEGSTIVGVYVDGQVNGGSDRTGGLIGYALNSSIEGVYITGQVSGGSRTGGLAGWVNGGSIHYSGAEASVAGGENTGGLVGYGSGDVTIYHSYTQGTGKVEGTGGDQVGGLVGYLIRGTIADCYSHIKVDGGSENSVGGLVGHVGAYQNSGNIYRSYSTGEVMGDGSDLGGLLGSHRQGTVAECYWDEETSKQSTSAGEGVEGKTTIEMQQRDTFTNYNFHKLWSIDEGNGYPFFQNLNNYTGPEEVVVSELAGSGEKGDPWVITTSDELNAIRQDLNAHYRLANDIDLTDTVVWNAGLGWEPVGRSTSGQRFTGSFDGNGHVIRNLTVNRPRTSYQGLFGYLEDAEIRNLELADLNVHGSSYTGGLAGYIINSTVEDLRIKCQIIGGFDSGGFVGRANDSSIESVYVTGQVKAGRNTGGLVGIVSGGSIHYSGAEASVIGGENTGGLVGSGWGSVTIYHSYTQGTGKVEGTGGDQVGGLIGTLGSGTIADSYSHITVDGGSGRYVGGLAGRLGGSSSSALGYIYRSYSTGEVMGDGTDLGGLLGRRFYGAVAECYWDMETSQQETSAGSAGGQGVEGKTTAEMQQRTNFTNYNFHKLWSIDEGYSYPFFQNLSNYEGPQEVVVSELAGSGTEGDPWVITTADELNAIRQDLTAHYRLESDLDLSDSVVWNAGLGWDPVGRSTAGQRFTGSFDGNGHVIRNLTINRPRFSYVGMFGYLEDAEIRNLELADLNVHGMLSYTGGLAAYILNSTVEDLRIKCQVKGWRDTGGLAGYASDSTFENVYITGQVSGDIRTGGLAGTVSGGSIHFSGAEASVAGGERTGGLVGSMVGGSILYSGAEALVAGGENTGGLAGYGGGAVTIYHSYTQGTGKVEGTGGDRVGGLVGYLYRGTIADCYSHITVDGGSVSRVGGLVGHIGATNNPGNIYRSYSTGEVMGDGSNLGGLLGSRTSGTVAECYWDVETSKQSTSAGGVGGEGVEGKTTAEMQQRDTFRYYNFHKLWNIDEGNGYPFFQNLNNYAGPQEADLADLDGAGTEGAPWIITTADELNAVRQDLNAHYRLENDIDLTDNVVWNAGFGWEPIGDDTNRFTGSFDGSGHVIRNLTVNRPGTRYQGLFGYLEDAEIRNLELADLNVHGSSNTGGLAGEIINSRIEGLKVNGQVKGRFDTGGLVGYALESTFEDVYITGQVSGGSRTGGLAGTVSGGSIHSSGAEVSVVGGERTGGLVGSGTGGVTIYHSYTKGTGKVEGTGEDHVGGLVGYLPEGTIVDSYSRVTVDGGSGRYVGGLVGRTGFSGTYTFHSGNIYRSYSTGLVLGTQTSVRGLLGLRTRGTVSECYWDVETSQRDR